MSVTIEQLIPAGTAVLHTDWMSDSYVVVRRTTTSDPFEVGTHKLSIQGVTGSSSFWWGNITNVHIDGLHADVTCTNVMGFTMAGRVLSPPNRLFRWFHRLFVWIGRLFLFRKKSFDPGTVQVTVVNWPRFRPPHPISDPLDVLFEP